MYFFTFAIGTTATTTTTAFGVSLYMLLHATEPQGWDKLVLTHFWSSISPPYLSCFSYPSSSLKVLTNIWPSATIEPYSYSYRVYQGFILNLVKNGKMIFVPPLTTIILLSEIGSSLKSNHHGQVR